MEPIDSLERLKSFVDDLSHYGKVTLDGRTLSVGPSLRVEIRPSRILGSEHIVVTISWTDAQEKDLPPSPVVGVLGGSASDFPVLEKAVGILTYLGLPSELIVVSAHRTPDRLFTYAEQAQGRGIEVIIAGAGGAAHLPGMVAAKTLVPVIGVPIPTEHLRGLDSLLSIVQMPRGVPVATVAIGGAENAGLLAAQMLAPRYTRVRDRLQHYREELSRAALEPHQTRDPV